MNHGCLFSFIQSMISVIYIIQRFLHRSYRLTSTFVLGITFSKMMKTIFNECIFTFLFLLRSLILNTNRTKHYNANISFHKYTVILMMNLIRLCQEYLTLTFLSKVVLECDTILVEMLMDLMIYITLKRLLSVSFNEEKSLKGIVVSVERSFEEIKPLSTIKEF